MGVSQTIKGVSHRGLIIFTMNGHIHQIVNYLEISSKV